MFIIIAWPPFLVHSTTAFKNCLVCLRRTLGSFIIFDNHTPVHLICLRRKVSWFNIFDNCLQKKNCLVCLRSRRTFGLFIIFDNHMLVCLVCLRRKISWFLYYNWHSHTYRNRGVAFLGFSLLFLTFPPPGDPLIALFIISQFVCLC